MSPPPVPPPPTQPGWSQPPRHTRDLAGGVVPAALVLALVAVAVTGTVAFMRHREVERLRAELADAQARVAELEAERDAGGGGLGELFGDLFGDGGEGLEGLLEGGLEGLLDGLLGGGDGLEGGADLSRCLTGGGLDGMLDGGAPIVAGTLAEQIDAIAERVEILRGLAFQEPIEPELVPTAEFVTRVTELVGRDYTAAEADHDRRVLGALGAVARDADLRALVLDIVSEQAAGFYDPETRQLVVRADDSDGPLGPAGQVILAHELAHALADQNLGLPLDDDEPDDADAADAGLALVEGDATLVMQRFSLGALDLGDQLEAATDPSGGASREQLTGYPEYVQRELMFPYTEGVAFVCELYADGGWAAIDAAYDTPPTTTARILWPQRSTAEPDGEVAVLGAPGGSWSRARTDTFGAAELLWLFSAPGDDAGAALDAPRERAAAWAGGRLELWTDGADSAVGVALAQRADERDLCGSMTDWYAAAFPDAQPTTTVGDEALASRGQEQDAVIVCDGDGDGDGDVRLAIAADLATARRVAG